MSADNGIYILQTTTDFPNGYEYRVAHLLAVENYQWDDKIKNYTDDPDIQIEHARGMWKNSKVFHNRESALKEADKLYQEIMNGEFPVIEYGISFIEIPRKF